MLRCTTPSPHLTEDTMIITNAAPKTTTPFSTADDIALPAPTSLSGLALSPVAFLGEKLGWDSVVAQAPALPEAFAFWGTAAAVWIGHAFVNRVFSGVWGKPQNSAPGLLKTTAISIGAGMAAEAGAIYWGDPTWTAATALFVAGAGALAAALVRETELKPWHAGRVAQMKQEHLDRVAERLPELEQLSQLDETGRCLVFEDITRGGFPGGASDFLLEKNELHVAAGQEILTTIFSALPPATKPLFIAWILDHYDHLVFLDRSTETYRNARAFVTELGKSQPASLTKSSPQGQRQLYDDVNALATRCRLDPQGANDHIAAFFTAWEVNDHDPNYLTDLREYVAAREYANEETGRLIVAHLDRYESRAKVAMRRGGVRAQ